MGYIQQEMLYLKLTIIRIELYRNLLIHHAFVCRISLLCQPTNRFLTQMNKLIQSVRAILKNLTKSVKNIGDGVLPWLFCGPIT